jgi:hypothetical protein
MVQITKASGEMVYYKATESSIIQMAIYIEGHSTLIEQMAMALISTKMDKFTKDIGKMICIMAKAEKSFQMAQLMKVHSMMEKEEDMASTLALTIILFTRVNGKKM